MTYHSVIYICLYVVNIYMHLILFMYILYAQVISILFILSQHLKVPFACCAAAMAYPSWIDQEWSCGHSNHKFFKTASLADFASLVRIDHCTRDHKSMFQYVLDCFWTFPHAEIRVSLCLQCCVLAKAFCKLWGWWWRPWWKAIVCDFCLGIEGAVLGTKEVSFAWTHTV